MDSWFNRIQQFTGKENISFYENIIRKRGIAVLLIQFCGLALAFAGNVFLARLYGEHVYGIYSLVTSWCTFLAVLGLFGMDDSHLVKLPTWRLRGEIKKISQQLKWSLSINSITISAVFLIFYLTLHFINLPGLSRYSYYFNFGLVLVLFLAIMNNLLSFLRGMDKVVFGEIIDKISRPLFLIVFLLLFYYLWKVDLVLDTILASSAGLFCIILLLSVKIRKTIRQTPRLRAEQKNSFSLRPNFRYVLLNLLYFLSTRMDLLLLGLFSNAILVGHYNVALKFADISSYPIAIINLSLPTMLSAVKQEKGVAAAPLLLYRVSRNSFFQCLLLGLLFLITGKWILQWYGKGFGDAFPILVAFLLSNLISAFIGLIDAFFILERQEKKPIYSRVCSLLISGILAFFLIPKWQLMGAAVSMVLGNLMYCIVMECLFFSRYGFIIHPFIPAATFNIPGKLND